MRVFDVFPFYNELDVLEIRLNELADVVDSFIILEAGETYGGGKKPYHLYDAIAHSDRFSKFISKIRLYRLEKLEPACADRVSGRQREAYQRNMMMEPLRNLADPEDAVIFSDCDEIPSARAVREYLSDFVGIRRFKQKSFYYTVNRMVDYGHDFASRARIGTFENVRQCGSLYDFRMYEKNICPAIEDGGWHFGYFGNGIEHIKNKVASMSPFLSEYKLFGDQQLVSDILNGKDLHHRRCEMPETFEHLRSDDPTLPKHFLDNRERFSHFTEDFYRQKYQDLL